MLSRLKQHKLPSFVIGGNSAIEEIFAAEGYPIAKGIGDAKIIIFQGGEDVSPYLYGDQKHPTTHCNEKRDAFEFKCYKATQGKFRIGICRGAQFLNVMNGGWLWQNVDGHASGPHNMKYEYERKDAHVTQFNTVTSTHHQLMHPKQGRAQIWGTAGQTTIREAGTQDPDRNLDKFIMKMAPTHNLDTEICFYPATRCLCFQPHPEYNSRETREIFFDCVDRMTNNACF